MSPSPPPPNGTGQPTSPSLAHLTHPQPTEHPYSADAIDLTLDSDDDEIAELPHTEFLKATDIVKKESEESTGVSDEIVAFGQEVKGEIVESVEREGIRASAVSRVTPRVIPQTTAEETTTLEDVAFGNDFSETSAPENILTAFIPPRPIATLPLTREEVIARDWAAENQLRDGIATYFAVQNANAPAALPIPAATCSGDATNPTGQTILARTSKSLSPEAEDIIAAADFHELKNKYTGMKKKHQTSTEDDINFRKAERAEDLRVRRQKKRAYADIDKEPEMVGHDSLFCSDGEHSPSSPKVGSSHQAAFRVEAPVKKVKTRVNKIPKSALEESCRHGLEAGRDIAKKTRSKKASTLKKDPKSRVSKPSKESDKKAKGKVGHSHKGPEMTNVVSLFNNDIIGDAQANKDKAAQPGFTSKRKDEALKELIASIPEEDAKVVSADSKALMEASRKFGKRGFVKAEGEHGWKMKGLKSYLYHYQLLGVAWMADRENATTRPHGGLCADSMGYGKTVQMIATILGNPPTPGSPNRTTLIVAPGALTTQWLHEIQKHTDPGALGQVLVHRSGNKVLSDDTKKALSNCGVVITTYHEVMRSYPHCKAPDHLGGAPAIDKWWQEYFIKHRGVLHQIFWRRIILDEAQQIKNHQSRTNIAVQGLSAMYRWALSGTPLMNRIEELYPYFEFLKVPHTGNLETFKKNFCAPHDKAVSRLHAMLRLIMIRRTGSDTLFDRPLLKLPELGYQTIHLDFNETERAVYRIVKNRFITRINGWLTKGDINDKYSSIWVLFLRLRQLCGHLLLIQDDLKSLLEAEDLEKLWRLTEKEHEKSYNDATIATMNTLRLILSKSKPPETQGVSEASGAATDNVPSTGGSFGATFKFRGYLRNLQESGRWEKINERSQCAKCGSTPPEQPYLTTPCEHLYCRECVAMILYDAAERDESKGVCVECDTVFEGSKPCVGFQQASTFPEVPDDDLSTSRRNSSGTPGSKDRDWLAMGDVVLPSAKTVACKVQILSWWAACSESEPKPKIIIFTQFLDMIKILSRMCFVEGWEYCTYSGAISQEARDRSITEFTKNDNKNILLASLKAGGLGLNLVMANRVIIIDPWWNSSVEDQAFSRVYRIGQTQNVEIVRFVVKNAIDTDIILKMQHRKDEIIDRAIGPNHKPGKLSIEELLRLFGPSHTGESGVDEILNDDEEDDDKFIFVEDEEANTDHSDDEVTTTIPPRPF